MVEEKENKQSISPGSSSNSFGDCSSCSSPEVDVVAFTPRPHNGLSSAAASNHDEDQKRYYCQRCLNHGQLHPRKGHKPFCQYANCECDDCRMVEERRRLNNMLSGGRSDGSNARHRDSSDGKKVRDPKCALCSAHGDKRPLRGHKKARCPFLKCGCHLCGLVENRRTLMARQIKLRRDQQKQRKAQMSAQAEKNISTYSQEGESCSLEPKKLDEPVRVPPLMPTVCRPQPAPFCCANRMITPQQLFPSPIHPPGFRMMPPFDYQFFSPLSFRFNTYFLMPQQYSPSFPVASPLDISYKALNP